MTDVIGKRFGRLIVLDDYKDKKGYRRLSCICDCGNQCIKRYSHVISGSTSSCGCKVFENKASVTHGLRWSGEYSIWQNMKNRCLNPNVPCFERYGGRGIKVSDRWMHSFQNFYDDMGPRPSPNHSIERINNEGNYEPGNCRWATNLEQSKNKRTTKLSDEKAAQIRKLRAEGVTYKALAKMFNVSEGSIGFVLKEQQWKPIDSANEARLAA